MPRTGCTSTPTLARQTGHPAQLAEVAGRDPESIRRVIRREQGTGTVSQSAELARIQIQLELKFIRNRVQELYRRYSWPNWQAEILNQLGGEYEKNRLDTPSSWPKWQESRFYPCVYTERARNWDSVPIDERLYTKNRSPKVQHCCSPHKNTHLKQNTKKKL